MMTTVWKAYSSEVVARHAIEAIRAAGVPGRDIRLLTGRGLRDVRDEPVGEFARPAGPNAPVGTYANIGRLRRQGAGAFAGDPDRPRQGSNAATHRDVNVTYDDGAERSRVAGDLGIRQLLRGAALDDAAVDRIVEELHVGHAVVLAEIAEIGPSDAQAQLDEVSQAA
jgi:hypothetical protein